MKYTYIGRSFCGPGMLDADMSVYELVSAIARNSRLTADEIGEHLLAAINAMLINEEEKKD